MGLLQGKEIDRVPCFSGMGNVTLAGLEDLGLKFSEVHRDAQKMAKAAASTHKLFGFESANVPFDVGLEAEALGCGMNFYEGREGVIYPTVKTKLAEEGEEIRLEVPEGIEGKGRVPMVVEAIQEIAGDIGSEVAVGAYVLGPFTLAGQVFDLNELLKTSFKEPDYVRDALDKLAVVIVSIASEMKKAGADFITIREMGASSDVISPKMFRDLVMPPLEKAIGGIASPRILHICGNAEPIVELMLKSGSEGISVEQRVDIARVRERVGEEAIILGNIDPFNVLTKGTPEDVKQAVERAIRDGVSGVMPGCDMWPEVPRENMRALVETTQEFGKLG